MKSKNLIRLQLDRQLNEIKGVLKCDRPLFGWIKTVRKALGMTSAQLAKRMNISQPRVSSIESSEIEDTLTLNTLKQAAEALNCKFVYFLIPETNLDEIVKNQAVKAVEEQKKHVTHSMGLENQSTDHSFTKAEAEALLYEDPSTVWNY